MPVKSVNIRLDDKFMHKHKEVKSFLSEAPTSVENQFKIHSMFNTASERRRSKDDGHHTPASNPRELFEEDKFRATDRTGHFGTHHSYSKELKQKIERMQLARLRIQKIRKADKAGFMIIKSHSPEKST